MHQHTQQLEPANGLKHIVLPPLGEQVSPQPSANYSIIKTYRNAISFIDQAGAMEGQRTIIGGFGLLFSAVYIFGTIKMDIGWAAFILSLVALVCLLIIRSDSIAFRYQPVVFNRATKKIHVFVDRGVKVAKLWQWSPDSSVDTWDWACARAELVEFVTLGAAGVPRTNYGLICAITDRPGGSIVVARFGIGIASVYESDTMLRRWEHVRRFMAADGPHLAPGDAKYEDTSMSTLWAALTWGQPLLGPGSGVYWTGKSHGGMWFLTIPAGLLFLPLLPFTMLAGLLRWLSHRARREPQWPKEILAELGPETSLPDRCTSSGLG